MQWPLTTAPARPMSKLSEKCERPFSLTPPSFASLTDCRINQVLNGLQNKGFLEHQVVAQIEDVIKERGTNDDDLGLASPNSDVDMTDAPGSESKSRRRPASHGLDKRQVEQRIEEDRERHKRERERIWAVPKGEDAEMTKLWEETSDFGEDDDRLLTEEGDDFTKEMEMQQCSHQQPTNGKRH